MTPKKPNSLTNPDIRFTIAPSGNCPVQAEGTVNGRKFYFKGRGNNLHLHIAPDTKRGALAPGGLEHVEAYKHEGLAGYITPAECREFIWKTAPAMLKKERDMAPTI